ncbi:MAG: hypothetical protein DHS20C14_08710 [Phycisphaeraceae bacterium]|nr:MAG: hypothetical protein DHS20C14_08710 [Phycisphaeraceae bacterium]
MGLSKERKIFAGVLGLAVVALVVDQGFLRPGSAGAAVVGPGVATVAPTLGGEEGGAAVPGAPDRQATSLSHIAARLRQAAQGGSLTDDAFELPSEWMDQATEDTAAPVAAVAPATSLQLSAVMPSPSGGVAVINGTPVRVGAMVGGTGYRLIALSNGEAILGNGSGTLRLSLPTSKYMPDTTAPKPERGLEGFGTGRVGFRKAPAQDQD